MQWSIQLQNWTETCSSVVKHTISQIQTAQTLTDMYAVKHTITKLNRDLQQCSDAYNTEYQKVKLHRHLQTCMQWSIQWQNWTETCSSAVTHTISQSETAQTLTDMYALKPTNAKWNRTCRQQTYIFWHSLRSPSMGSPISPRMVASSS